MQSTFEQGGGEATKSLNQSWRHCKDVISASTLSEAWRSCQSLIDALPLGALLLLLVLATLFVIDGSILIATIAALAFLFVTYATVRRAVADGIRETR